RGCRAPAGGSKRCCARKRRTADVTHPAFEAQLDAYLDGELAASDAAELEAHLRACPDCARLERRHRAVSAAVRKHVLRFPAPDQHTVKPWFNGKLDFSPPVYDFAGRGFPLIGGRLEYVGGRPVAALVYARRQHLINVFLWPAESGPTGGRPATTRQGYHLLHWTTPAYSYWVASDLGLPELRDFAALLQRGDSVAP